MSIDKNETHQHFLISWPSTTATKVFFSYGILTVLWMITRPYVGIISDAQLYSLQALSHLLPGLYASDLFFKYGSQDKFTLYGIVLAAAVSKFGLSSANFIMNFFGAVFWLASAIILVRTLTSSFAERIASLWTIVLLPPAFGSIFLAYAQQYQSPRIFTEALDMLSIALALRSRWGQAAISLVVGAVIHPLMVVPGIGTVFFLSVQKNTKFLIIPALGSLICLILAFDGIDPFDRLMKTVDPCWLSVLLMRCRYAFVTQFTTVDLIRLASQIVILILATHFSKNAERRVIAAITMTVALGLIVNFVGADVFHNVLIINAQFNRVTWLLSIFSNIQVGLLFIRLKQLTGTSRIYLMTSLAIYGLTFFFGILVLIVLPMLLTSIVLMTCECNYTFFPRLVALTGFAIIFFLSSCAVIIGYFQFRNQIIYYDVDPEWFRNVTLLFILIVAVILFVVHKRIIACGILIVSLITAAANFDQRNAWEKFLDAGTLPPPPILTLLNASPNIYWENNVKYIWFSLHRPSFYSSEQGTGAMFYRQTAMEWLRRGARLSVLNTRDFSSENNDISMPKQNPRAYGPDSVFQLSEACTALPELDLIILYTDVPNTVPIIWNTHITQYILMGKVNNQPLFKPDNYYYIYKCKDYRASPSS